MKKLLFSSLLLSVLALSVSAMPMDGDKPAKAKKSKKSCCGGGGSTSCPDKTAPAPAAPAK